MVYFRVMDGEIKKGDKIKFMASGKEYEVVEVSPLRGWGYTGNARVT